MAWSITARCPDTGQFGVAVSTCVPAVGALCPYVRAGVGAIASQSFVNPYIGLRGLDMLESGMSAEEVLMAMGDVDPDLQLRQFAIVDARGRSVAHSGSGCDGWFGDYVGDGFVVAGNMLVSEETITGSVAAFEGSAGQPLAERLVTALQAGQDAGGDKRGRQSAAVKVAWKEDYPLVDLRVDEHPDPVAELRRVFEVASQQLLPLVEMLPTRDSPAGTFDMQKTRDMGLLQD